MPIPCPFCGQGALDAPAPGVPVRCPRCLMRLTLDDFLVPPRRFAGHRGPVFTVALAPDGRHALSGSDDRTLRLWDLDVPPGADPARHTFAGHTDTVNAVAVTRDGQQVLSGARDCTVRLWDLRSGTLLRTFTGHTRGVRTVAVSPDGRHVLSGGDDTTLILWDLAMGGAVRTLHGHRGTVWAVAISPDGQRALSAGADDRVRLWDLHSGQPLWTGAWSPEFHDPDAFSYENLWSVTFTADGRGVLTGAETSLQLWDFSTDRPRQIIETYDEIHTVALSPSGRYALAGQQAGLVQVWDLATPPTGGTARRVLRANSGGVFSMALSADGRRLIAGGAEHWVRAWSLPADFFA